MTELPILELKDIYRKSRYSRRKELWVLGQGAAAIVYLKKLKTTKKDVAVKKFYSSKYAEEDYKHEIRIFKYLNEFNEYPESLVKLIGTTSDKHTLVLNCLNRPFISAKHFIGLKDHHFTDHFRSYVTDLYMALRFLHSHDVVHRDIKLENIVLNYEEGRAMLIDLGIACAKNIEQDVLPCELVHNNRDGNFSEWRVLGTFVYIADDVIVVPEDIDIKNTTQKLNWLKHGDVYSLLVSLLFLTLDKDVPGEFEAKGSYRENKIQNREDLMKVYGLKDKISNVDTQYKPLFNYITGDFKNLSVEILKNWCTESN